MRKKKKKELNTLDKYIIFTFTMIIIYTAVHTAIFYLTGTEAKVLDVLFFGAFGGEILYCFLLKRFKLHEEAKIVFNKKSGESVGEEFTEE